MSGHICSGGAIVAARPRRARRATGVCDPSASPWRGGDDCAGAASGLNGCDAAGAAAHMRRVADFVATLGADVLNMVEVEGCAQLGILANAMDEADAPGSTGAAAGGVRPREVYLLNGKDTALVKGPPRPRRSPLRPRPRPRRKCALAPRSSRTSGSSPSSARSRPSRVRPRRPPTHAKGRAAATAHRASRACQSTTARGSRSSSPLVRRRRTAP